MHERLAAVFGTNGLPEFPPRHHSIVGAIFGASGNAETIAERERAFQRYFDKVCESGDMLRTQVLQMALAVTEPEPVSSLRVTGWVSSSHDDQALSALIDIQPSGQEAESSAVVDAYHVLAILVQDTAAGASDEEPPVVVADFRLPSAGTLTQARVETLRPGAQVEFRVCALNAVSTSSPVAIRVAAPARATSCKSTSKPASADEDLIRRKDEFEREMAARRLETERADAELRRKEVELQEQQEQFEQMRSRSPSIGRSPVRSRSSSDDACRDNAADLENERIELELRARELALQEEEHVAKMQRSAEQQRAEREALELEREELHEHQAKLRHAEQAAAAISAARASELEEQEATLARKREAAERDTGGPNSDAFQALQQELEERKAEIERERAEHEELRRDQAAELLQAEAELLARAENLARTEEALLMEREEITRSRASLKVVQAHVVSMLNKAMPDVDGTESMSHRLDDDLDAEDEVECTPSAPPAPSDLNRDSSLEQVWNIDWASHSFPQRTPDATPRAAGSPVRSTGSPARPRMQPTAVGATFGV